MNTIIAPVDLPKTQRPALQKIRSQLLHAGLIIGGNQVLNCLIHDLTIW
jgi:hypothetical protein